MLLRRYRVEQEVVDELKPLESFEFDGKSVDELKVYAMENQIDIGNSSSVNGILKKIKDAQVKE